jgi:ubiquinone biosynthesis protein UbiJ
MTDGLWAPLEIAINGILQLDPETPRRLAALQRKTLAIEFKGVGLRACFLFSGDRVHVLGDPPESVDATLIGTPIALASLGLDARGSRSLFDSGVEVQGDVDVARRAKAVLDAVSIDWEEQVARLLGDPIAHQLGSVVRGALAWGHSLFATLEQDLAEYLQDESDTLPRKDEVTAFMDAVDGLRADVDRLAARVRRINKRLAAGASVADR